MRSIVLRLDAIRFLVEIPIGLDSVALTGKARFASEAAFKLTLSFSTSTIFPLRVYVVASLKGETRRTRIRTPRDRVRSIVTAVPSQKKFRFREKFFYRFKVLIYTKNIFFQILKW